MTTEAKTQTSQAERAVNQGLHKFLCLFNLYFLHVSDTFSRHQTNYALMVQQILHVKIMKYTFCNGT